MNETSQRERERERGSNKAGSGSGIGPRQILFGILILIALLFVLTNFQKVQVDYIVGSAETPLWLLIALSIGLGMLIDRGLMMRGRHLDRKRGNK